MSGMNRHSGPACKRDLLLSAIDAALADGTITRRDMAIRLGRGSGGGRPQSDVPRCACGRFTLVYAARWRPRHSAEACPTGSRP